MDTTVWLLTIFTYLWNYAESVPTEACFANFRWDDCGYPPQAVLYYYKPGSRCEVGFWRGCLPNPNMFKDEYECVNTCIFSVRAHPSDYHNINEVESFEINKELPIPFGNDTDDVTTTPAGGDVESSSSNTDLTGPGEDVTKAGAGAVEDGKEVAAGGTNATADGKPPPADGGAAPADGGAASADGERAPLDGGGAPADGGGAPADGGGAPADGGGAPADGGGAPANGGGAPADGGGAPAGGGDEKER